MTIRHPRAHRWTAIGAVGIMLFCPGSLGFASFAAMAQTTTAKPTPTPTQTAKPTATPTPTTTTKPAATPTPAPAGTRTAPPAGTTTTPAGTTAKPAASQTAATTAKPTPTPTPTPPPDGGWPRTYFTEKGARLIIYQPQIATWTDQVQMVAYSAVSYTPKGAPKQTLGTIKFTADTRVSVTERLVDFSAMKVVESNFPTLEKDKVQEIIAEITSIPIPDRIITLDRVLAGVDKSLIVPKNVEGVKAEPPTIFFSQTPARLVNIDGEAVYNAIKENDLKFAINTNWDLFEHAPTKTYYLRDEKTWLKSEAVTGPWVPAGKLPESFKKLPKDDDNFKEVRDAVPGKSLSPKAAPKIFVSLTPAEMILLKGAPVYVPIAKDSKLLWVSNTDSDVFRMGEKGLVYYLVSGRWFSAPDFTGPWTFATPTLPAEFLKISLEHDRSRVLASVPGSAQAAEAVLLASVPEKATVLRKSVKAPDVAYDGQPVFKTIESTTVEHAQNTDKDIFKIKDVYYMCFQGVWFYSGTPNGPWEVADSIPKEIYSIPVSSSAHNVTYVTVQESNDDAVVFATAAAYTGLMVAWGCVVWGSGYYYPPYWGYGYGYPMYYGRYPSYGYSAWYNPWTGAYGRSMGVYGPYGGAGMGARYNPRTGTYARGAVAYGPNGARGVASAYNPRTGTAATTRQGSGTYGSWGQTSVARGDNWATTNRYTNNRGTTTRTTETSEGGKAISRTGGVGGNSFAGVSGNGDVYAGRDGNVYRQQGDGWQKYENGSWNNADSVNPQNRTGTGDRTQAGTGDRNTAGNTAGNTARTQPGNTSAGTGNKTFDPSQLNSDSRARSEGAQRTRDAGAVRSGSSTARPSSYRPTGGGGGMSRGGGGGGGRRR